MATKNINLDEYVQYFSESKLWNKLRKVARKAGRKAVYYALVLYYVARDPSVPSSMKLKILGALGYFILPTDLLPDFIPGTGRAHSQPYGRRGLSFSVPAVEMDHCFHFL